MTSKPEAVQTDAVSVVYTTVEDTLEAARVGAGLARAMGSALRVVHFRTVPPQLPVDRPDGLSPVESDEFVSRLFDEGISARLRVYLCRHEDETFPFAFEPRSIIVIGGRRSWLPTRAERRRHALEAAGHFVLLVDPSEHEEPFHA